MESYVLVFVKSFKIYWSIFFIIQMDELLMYHKFDYNYKNQPLLLALGGCLQEKKNRQISGA